MSTHSLTRPLTSKKKRAGGGEDDSSAPITHSSDSQSTEGLEQTTEKWSRVDLRQHLGTRLPEARGDDPLVA